MDRVKTGISGLDEMLGGGFLPESANLVEGAPGTGKTTVGMQFIYNGIVHFNEPGLIITFEEFPKQYYHDATTFGWDFPALERQGLLKIVMTSPEVSQMDLESVGGFIEGHIRDVGARRVVVDSVSHFARLTQNPVELRSLEFKFINALKRERLTSLLTRESPVLLGDSTDNSSIGFVVDSYILLRYVEIESAIRKALLVLKMRGSDHAKDIRQYSIAANGIEVQSKFEGQEGILSGNPRKLAASFVEAFVKK
ncbi:MAG TPA: ATPase domain-containing protein [Anaerolineae bacterium]|nr:ATPase domain-containing protein [Anaerolineae bacterium]HMR62649.1 ATPase domain-containing protein [Anaerolineae bacterium]